MKTAVFPDISENHIIIDAIFGIGLTHEMDLWIQKIIQKINYHQSFTISIDVPSGLFLEKKTILAHTFRCCFNISVSKTCFFLT
jgi:NAD(P)H-hydrate repair Nnr-like enzyme with NAD(P)H-hydrate epimerase domain